MPRDLDITSRENAERRVRERQARQTAELNKWHQAERQKDFRSQKKTLDQLAEKESALTEERRKALEALDRQWEKERDRLAPRMASAPAFGLLPAPRNLQQEYVRAREAYETRRTQLKERFDEGLSACQRERVDLHHRFQTANLAREQAFSRAYTNLVERQNRGFERAVRKEMGQDGKSLGEEFARKSRAPGRHI